MKIKTPGLYPVSVAAIKRMDPAELQEGIIAEKEHTPSLKVALNIAAHHLLEFPDYYTRLARMERQARAYWSRKRKA